MKKYLLPLFFVLSLVSCQEDNDPKPATVKKERVLLESIGVKSTGDPSQDIDFFRILPDGTITPSGPEGYRVPEGYYLIITDVDWQYAFGNAGGRQTLRIFIESLTRVDPPLSQRVFESTIILNIEGEGGISESMTSGFVVSPQVRLRVDASPGGGKIQHVLLRGYLIPTN